MELGKETALASLPATSALPTVTFEKPVLPTLWLDTSVVIKLAKINRDEALQAIEVQRGTRLRELIFELVRAGKLLCPESDQEEEYAGQRIDDDVHRMFAQLSHGISLSHRQGILDQQIFKGMESYVKKSDTIHLPSVSYFHGDPVRRLEEARKEHFIVSVGPLKSPEILRRRYESKMEISRKWEELRQELVSKKQTYEKQLEMELHGYWDGLIEIIRRFETNMISGQYNLWDFMAATGPLLYRRVWNDMGGHPAGWEGVDRYFRSPYFSELPLPFINCRLGAELLTRNEPIAPSDSMDVELLAVALPVAHYVLADRRMELRIKKLGLDTRHGVAVFSMSSIDGLFAELEKLK